MPNTLPPDRPRAAMQPPHRFVPTLTEVVNVPPSPLSKSSQTIPAPAFPMRGAVDDRSLHTPPSSEPATSLVKLDADALRDEIVHRVMQRVELSLNRQLPQALDGLITAHLDLLLPLLTEEIQATVSRAVDEALADEL